MCIVVTPTITKHFCYGDDIPRDSKVILRLNLTATFKIFSLFFFPKKQSTLIFSFNLLRNLSCFEFSSLWVKMDRSEDIIQRMTVKHQDKVMYTLDHGEVSISFLNPCSHCKRCSHLHICKSELVYKNYIKKVKLFKCDIN